MRILHLAKYYWPHSGGMERVVQDLAEGAAALGHQVQVVAVQSGGRRGDRGRQPARVTRVFSFGALGSQEIAPGYLAAAHRRADVIHVHHPHPLADLAALIRTRRAALVVTQHADAHRPSYRILARAVLARAAAIVVPSRAHVALSKELSGHESKVEVIPFGIDVRRWAAVPPRPDGAPPKALFIGRLVRYKGLDILLRALERVPDLRLDVVGTGPEAPRLKTLAQALALADRVRWYGEYPDEDLPRRMAEADFLVLPSVTVEEMFGLVALEAMAAGRPVITTAVPTGVREVNVPGETGLEVPIRDVDALAHALELMARDPGLRRRMGDAGRRRVQAHFTREAMAERHVELYQRLLQARASADGWRD
ncbi:MAG TPA: glycosyltransferase [Gemmatimonadales bacterium]|nr:glycosyltransferase [Gemmatimonadales bacterium]